jgi:hypothetical protein
MIVLKIFKNVKIILEIEEIYSEVWGKYKKFNKIETLFFKISHSFIVVSNKLKTILSKMVKKNIICLFGSYEINNFAYLKKFDNNHFTNLVFAGSIETLRNGAFKALEILEILPENYRLFILGNGSRSDTSNLVSRINEINSIKQREACIFLGVKVKDELNLLLSNCHIGLNPQNLGDYMQSAFPSKILTYLASNLRVVSTKVESTLDSPFSKLIFFSKSESAIDLMNSILKINLNSKYSSLSFIKKEEVKFLLDLKYILNN